MNQEKRFGKRIAEPSSVQIIHELKLMALRQAVDAAAKRDAAETRQPSDRDAAAHDITTSPQT